MLKKSEYGVLHLVLALSAGIQLVTAFFLLEQAMKLVTLNLLFRR